MGSSNQKKLGPWYLGARYHGPGMKGYEDEALIKLF